MSNFKITPTNCTTHSEFQKQIEEWFVSKDFTVIDTTYHNLLPVNQVKQLQKNKSFVSQYLRTTPDLNVLRNDTAFQIEVKSNNNLKYRNASLEVFPLMVNSTLSKLNIETIYFYKDFVNGREVFFNSSDCPEIDRIIIPTWRWNATEQNKFKEIFIKNYPNVDVISKDTARNGSGDPFAIIVESELEKLETPAAFFERF